MHHYTWPMWYWVWILQLCTYQGNSWPTEPCPQPLMEILKGFRRHCWCTDAAEEDFSDKGGSNSNTGQGKFTILHDVTVQMWATSILGWLLLLDIILSTVKHTLPNRQGGAWRTEEQILRHKRSWCVLWLGRSQGVYTSRCELRLEHRRISVS